MDNFLKIRMLGLSGIAIGAFFTGQPSYAGATNAMQSQALEQKNDTLVTPSYEELDEVVISAEKPMIKTDGAKLTYNVDEDPAAGSSSALDILKKVPQVSVDGDGNIRLNGSGNFKLKLNGLDNPMLKEYGDKILDGMPGNMIVRIEVITEPGAKEDAEGNAGIINIITERTQQKAGYSGTASLKVDNRSLSPSLFGTFKKDNVTVSANMNYSWGFAPQRHEQEMTTTYRDSNETGSLLTKVGQKVKYHYVNGGLNLSWEPDKYNLFTAGADVFYLDGNVNSMYGSTQRFDLDNSLLWSFNQDGKGALKIFTLSANASYKHSFREEGQNYLVFSYLFNFGRNNLWLNRWYSDLVDYETPFTYQNQNTLSFNRGHTVQADYANDFKSEHHLMEVGVKGIFRHNTALAGYGYGNQPDAVIFLPELSSDILQPQNIYSAYGSYTGSFDKLGVVAGLRYEHTLMGITNRLDSREDFRNRLNDVVPNAALTWNFSNSSNVRLAYQMRISRPSIDQVNPFQLSFTPYEVNEGNPDLTSERSHMVSLKYSGFGRIFGGSVGVEYKLVDNQINSFTFLREEDGINTIVTSYANIGKTHEATLAGFLNWSIISQMSLTLNGRLQYDKLMSPAQGYSNHGWSGNIGGAWNYTVADVNKFSAFGMWSSRSVKLQGYSSGFYYYGISAARDFLKDKSLTVSLSASNFIGKTMTFKSHTETPNVIYNNVAKNLTAWNVGVSVSWKFGNLNAKVKDTGVKVQNDDINSSSNKGQGGL